MQAESKSPVATKSGELKAERYECMARYAK